VLDKLHSAGGGILLFAVDVIVGKLAGANWPPMEQSSPVPYPLVAASATGSRGLANDYIIKVQRRYYPPLNNC
jgi:hypothetical protein